MTNIPLIKSNDYESYQKVVKNLQDSPACQVLKRHEERKEPASPRPYGNSLMYLVNVALKVDISGR
tara:strand:+ start:125 stop:322 length:198 start_codon:yes stop_codon:yes gene_type:complete